VLRLARACPDALAIGVDAAAAGLRQASRRAHRPLRKGGLPNVMFLVADATEALTAFDGKAGEVRITLPWGSLLRDVLRGERDFAHAVAGSL
jgi:16S rRNA (adenine(1408)-N(1))-methyltransferase